MTSTVEPAERSVAPATLAAVYDRMRFGSAHVKIAIALFVVFVIESWEQLALVYVSGDIAESFGIDAVQIGWVLSAVAIGMIPGALIWGPLADRFGRKPISVVSLIAYGVVAALVAFAPNYETLFALRVVSGFALAGAYTVTFPYFLELMPTGVRGRATVLLSIGWPIGTLAALGATVAFGDLGWQVVALASAVACVWVFVLMAWVPESPYYLVRRGRDADARAVLAKLGTPVEGHVEIVAEAEPKSGSPLELIRKPLLVRTLLMLVINFAFNWGYWGLQVWLPTLLQERGLSLDASLGFVAISALIMIPGYLVAAWLTKRFGRKKLFLAFVLGSIAGGVLFAYSWDLPSLYAANFLLSFFILGGWGIWNTWNGEFYPTRVRAAGFSWATSAQLLANAIAPSVVGALLVGSVEFTVTVLFITAFLVVTFLAALPLPETEGKPLD
ncbi:MFS transporter [Agromyces binzhouensis]|nr:MFS transporter [Agromyces binzhouensis]